MSKKAIVFDFDGTLVNSFDLINKCLLETIENFKGIEIPKERMFEYFSFGPTEEGILLKSLVQNHREAYIYFLNLYNKYHTSDLIYGFNDEVIQILKMIKEKGVKVILLTGRGNETLAISLAKFDAFKYFDDFYTGSLEGAVKNELLRNLMKDYSFKNDEIVYVGDSFKDHCQCKEVNVKCINVSYYNEECKRRILKGEKDIILASSFKELKDLILEEIK